MVLPDSLRQVADRITPLSFGIIGKSLDGGEPWAAGSGVFIAPYLGLTAKHVVEGTWNAFEPEWKRNKWPKREERATHFLVLTQKLYFGRSEEATWVVEETTPIPWTDLMILRISPQNELARAYQWGTGFLDLQLLPPTVGDRVWVLGYPECRAENDPDRPDGITGDFKVEINGAKVTGVEDLGPGGLKYFPGFEFAPTLKGGGSGGPIVCDGRLCGIACIGWEGDGAGTGYAATLWPIIFAKINLRVGEMTTILQLMKESALIRPAVDLAEVERRAVLENFEDGPFGGMKKRARLRPR